MSQFKKMYTIEKYFESINKLINYIILVKKNKCTNNISTLSFDELYRGNYEMTIQQHYNIINTSFMTARNEILKLNYDKQQTYFNILCNVFMYPIRMNVIDKYTCLVCSTYINHDNLYCNKHMIEKQHLNNIKNFKLFNKEGLVGGRIYEDTLYNVI